MPVVLQAIKMSKRASNDEAGSMPKKARPDGKDAIVATILEQIRDKSRDCWLLVLSVDSEILQLNPINVSAWRAIQRVGHSRRNKPVSTVSVGLPSRYENEQISSLRSQENGATGDQATLKQFGRKC